MTRRPLRVVHRSHRTRPLRRIRPVHVTRAGAWAVAKAVIGKRWPSSVAEGGGNHDRFF